MDTPRRVVTGHNENGRSIVVIDSGPGRSGRNDIRRIENHEIWATDESPAAIVAQPEDPMVRPIQLVPLPGGSVIRISEYGPDPFSNGEPVDPEMVKAGFAFVGAEHVSQWKPGLHPGMHRTETVDYAVVLDGEIDLLLDEEEVHLVRGDTVIQCGTNHAWANRSNGITRMLFVLMDGSFDDSLGNLLEGTPQ